MSSSHFELLQDHILSLSRADEFHRAKHEWGLDLVILTDELDSCPCGQAIKEHCYISNRVTGHSTWVGNVCIKHFLGVDATPLFNGIKKIRKDPAKSCNDPLTEHAIKMMWLNDWEIEFLKNTNGKRSLTLKQAACRERINRKILNKTVMPRRI